MIVEEWFDNNNNLTMKFIDDFITDSFEVYPNPKVFIIDRLYECSSKCSRNSKSMKYKTHSYNIESLEHYQNKVRNSILHLKGKINIKEVNE